MKNIKNEKNKKFIITGGCGFIGSTLVDYLLSNKFADEILVIDDLSSGYKKNLLYSRKIKLINCKIQDFDTDLLDDDFCGIFHLAAQTSVPYSMDNFFASSSNNLLSTLKVIDIAKNLKIPVIYASSSAVYGNLPKGNDAIDETEILSPYAQDKLTMEYYFKISNQIFNVSSIGIRFFNVYGPKQDPSNPYSGVISIFIENLLNKKPVIVNGGYQTRDFIFVGDIANVLHLSMQRINQNDCLIFNAGTGVSISINDLLKKLIKLTQSQPEVIKKELPLGDPKESSGTYRKMEDILNIKTNSFYDLESGLLQTVKYIKDNVNG
tara:strand:+ start:919 stop:1884 length:966 start_codon:yes stop_codon:yes gene_type:complete